MPTVVTGDTATLGRDDVPEMNPTYLFRWEEFQKAHVLLYPEGVVKLNETAGAILALCDGARTANEIATAIAADFAADDVQSRVFRFLEACHAKGWIRLKS
jgi:pyrroloquinoline quinone biosynthesis protein D